MTKLIYKLFSRIDHPHTIVADDYALGIEEEIGIPVTAFRYHCILCGRKYDLMTESGMVQLCEGNKAVDVLRWQE